MVHTVTTITDDARRDLFDTGTRDDNGELRDVLWADSDFLSYTNSACARLASDTLALRRRFALDVAAGNPLVRFPYDQVLDILQVSYIVPGLGTRRALRHFDPYVGVPGDDYGAQTYFQPDLGAGGMPGFYTRDVDDMYLRMWKVPHMAGTLDVVAIALPAELYAGMPLPFQARADIDLLLLWIKHLAYAKHDADTLDLARSNEFAAQYRDAVVRRKYEIDRVRRDGGVVRPS